MEVTWNGEPTTWNDYARQVQLCWEKTQEHKRKLLGPALASKLTGRAWAVTPDLDHRRLGKKHGCKYLLNILQDRLCRTAIPDAGSRLEDLLIRLRRPPGMSMSQWSNEVLEAYRKVQRALIRARQLTKAKDKYETLEKRSESEPHREPPTVTSPTSRRSLPRSTPTSPTRPTPTRTAAPSDARELPAAPDQPAQGEPTPDEIAREEEERDAYDDYGQGWTDDEWRQWRKQQRKEWYEESSSGEDLPWDELQVEDIQVLPDEVLGWLLLRRANLSASSRLSVQAAVSDSLKFRDIELALRDQEEELLQADHHRPHHSPKRRTYWVEEEGEWGLVNLPAEDLEECADVHWVGRQLPPEVYQDDPTSGAMAEDYDDEEIFWTWEPDGWHGYVYDGVSSWLETDGCGTYWASQENYGDFTSEEQKELDELYMAYENKARTFTQSRQLQRAKGTSRGFYPISMMKGGKKGKGRGKSRKGKGYGSSSSTTPPSSSAPRPLYAAQPHDGATTTTGKGCFICGDMDHGFRHCPKRGLRQPSFKGSKKGAFWVESLTSSPLAFIGMALGMEENVILDTKGYGVLDLGATETVGSLEALEDLMHLRSELHGIEEPVEVFSDDAARKPFRFGNGGVQYSSSYVMVPQRLGDQCVMLGLYTIDAEKVPILLGMKTLRKLGAIIDVYGQWMVLAHISPKMKIPLARSKAGHLLLDLTRDWLNVSRPLQSSATGGAYKGRSQSAVVSGTFEAPMFHAAPAEPSESVHEVERVWMMEEDGDDHAEEDSSWHDDVFVLAHDHSHQPLQSSTQVMRDEILQQLAQSSQAPDPRSPCHGSQGEHLEGQGQGFFSGSTADREVRLEQDPGPRCEGPAMQRAPMLRGAHGSSNEERISVRGEQMGQVDRLRGVWVTPELHPDMGESRSLPPSRTPQQRRSGSSRDQEAGQGEPRLGEQEDRFRRSGTFFGDQAEDGARAEDRLDGHAGQEGQPRQDRQQAGDKGRNQEPRAHPRIFGPSASGIRFDAFTSTGDYRPRGGHGPYSRTQSSQGNRAAGGAGVSTEGQSTRIEDRRLVSGQQLAGNFVNEDMQGSSLAPSHEVSPSPNSSTTANPMASSMHAASEKEAGFEGQQEDFTPEDILLTGSSRGKRRKDAADNEVLVDKLNNEETAFLVEELNKHNSEIDELFIALQAEHPGRVPLVLELCCEEDSGITAAVERRGGRGIRCGLHNGCDLNKKSGFNKVLSLIKEEKPDLLWVSLPCGPTSSIQELNMLTPEGYAKVQAKVAKSRKLAGRATTLMEVQVAEGREVVQEWPRYNKAWQFKTIQGFWHRNEHHEAYLDGCAFGLKAPCGGALKKPWRLKSTTRRVWKMQKICSCSEPHVPCEGGNLTRRTALYPQKMCVQVAKMLEEIHGDLESQVYAVDETEDIDMDVLEPYTDMEVNKTAAEVLKLHKKLGHPSRQAFVKMLRDRGAGKLIRTLANTFHCPDCQEAAIPPSRRAVTLEQATELWEVIQVDNMEVTIGEDAYHFQVIIDEASGYGAVNYLFKHHVTPGSGRNATTEECLAALHRGWVQYFGYPKIIKLDKEGAHRGRAFEEWAEGHSIEIQPVPAEAHGQIGQVERLIGTLKRKLMSHLRSSENPPEVAAWAMIGAHNTMTNVGGYSPSQWVFGRNFSDSMRLHDGQDLSYWSGMASSKKMQKQLARRQEAEQKHRDFILKEKINTAYNTKMATPVRYEPGDLVFYKRFQPPSDAKERSHRELDVPRRRVARWYGPARVLALETKVTYDGHVRQPHSIAWIIASGRLKKVHCNQLRHSSPRERLVAEGTTQLTLPWTFQDMTHLISKGEYDDEIMLDKHMRADAKRFRHEHEELHRQHRSKNKRALEEEAGTTPSSPSTGHSYIIDFETTDFHGDTYIVDYKTKYFFPTSRD